MSEAFGLACPGGFPAIAVSDGRESPLVIAASNANLQIVRILLDAGAEH